VLDHASGHRASYFEAVHIRVADRGLWKYVVELALMEGFSSMFAEILYFKFGVWKCDVSGVAAEAAAAKALLPSPRGGRGAQRTTKPIPQI
jgi:hypothetical protein